MSNIEHGLVYNGSNVALVRSKLKEVASPFLCGKGVEQAPRSRSRAQALLLVCTGSFEQFLKAQEICLSYKIEMDIASQF